ncbi:MAG: hypothetical protein VXW87_04870 [Pseudomonadota bacterium]|nr:hypothetical protein [Pseudomonadota bacterium]
MFNVKSWIGWDSISQNGTWIGGLFNAIIKKPDVKYSQETYEEACEKYRYTSEFLQSQKEGFLFASKVYFSMFMLGVFYLLYLAVNGYMLSAFIMLPVNFMVFSLFFRESFWYMQLKHKKLGMTFRDWMNFIVLNNG